MAKSTTGSSGSFTYDFGILISQTTVGRLMRTAQASLTLASAYYALNKQATEYIDTLRKQQIFFGGQVATMKAMADAQERVIQGTSRFDVSDQLEGMNNLMRVGIDARKEFEWTEKAAHAMGVSYSQFANAIANGVRGNMGGLVEMGLITERATRMFDKYQGNTVMRQQAILNFVKQHKTLQTAIRQDFGTIQDEMRRLTAVWKSFLQSILGQPNDPGSFYGQVRSTIKEIADGFARNTVIIRRYAFQIGQVLGWVIRQIGHLATWLGRQVKNVLQMIWRVGDNYKEAVRSVLVWLEFWKVAIIDFFKKYEKEIKNLIKWLLIFMVAKKALVIGEMAIKGLYALGKAVYFTSAALVGAIRDFGLFRGIIEWLIGFLPLTVQRMLVSLKGILIGFGRSIAGVAKVIWASLFGSNPVGWIVIAIAAAIAGLVLLYKKCEGFRNFVNDLGKTAVQAIRFVWNSLMWLYVQARLLIRKAWTWLKNAYVWIKTAIGNIAGWFSKMWDKFMDTRVGQWINKHIIQPLTTFFNWVSNLIQKVFGKIANVVSNLKGWFTRSADKVGQSTAELAAENGIKVPIWSNPFPETPSGNTATPAPTATLPTVSAPAISGASETLSTMNFNQGAIQIMLNGSSGIDENILAQKIKEVILDLDRQGRMRGGRA